MTHQTELLIIGGGPAGLSAAIYAGRARLQTVLLERGMTGGQITQTNEIENYPGSPPEESGVSLTSRMAAQAETFGAKLITDPILKVEVEGPVKRAQGQKDVYEAKAVILATGTRARLLGCPGEKEFTGRGVSYCATCDGMFFRGLPIYVVGGGDAAVVEAMFLTRFGRHVTIIHRRDALRAAASIVEKAKNNSKISFIWNSVVEEIGGGEAVNKLVLKHVQTGEKTVITAPEDAGRMGVFVMVGQDPISELFPARVKNERGYILTDENMATALPGVFAAGDVREKRLRQVITAASDGAIAATQAMAYIEQLK